MILHRLLLTAALLGLAAPAMAQQLPGRIGVRIEQIDLPGGTPRPVQAFVCDQPDAAGPGCAGDVTLVLDGRARRLVARVNFATNYAFLTLREAGDSPDWRLTAHGEAETGPLFAPVLRRSGLPALRLRVTVLHRPD